MRSLQDNRATLTTGGTSLASKTFTLLMASTAIAAGGAWVGWPLAGHPFILMACIIAELVGLFILYAVRENTQMGLLVLAGWMGLSGITTGVAVHQYATILGMNTVIGAFLGTAGVMCACGLLASFSNINVAPMRKFMTIGLLALIVTGIVSWFVRFSPMINMVYSGIGMALFTLFFIADFARLARDNDNSWSNAIGITLSIYLDFINFFLFLLRFLSSRDRD
jgi:FtsH-binding integral membrane protein